MTFSTLHPDLVGFRIAHLSDIHVGATTDKKRLAQLVTQVNALKVDMVAVTGDLVDGTVKELAQEVAPLFALQATHGTHFCTGNHEYYYNATAWCSYLEKGGVSVWINNWTTISHGEATLLIAGTPDPTGCQFIPEHKRDPAGLMARTPQSNFKLLLAHQPKCFERLLPGQVDLCLSGHTHGGQFFPFTLMIRPFQPLLAGVYQRAQGTLLVSRGATHWGPPIRLGAPHEIPVITLQRS